MPRALVLLLHQLHVDGAAIERLPVPLKAPLPRAPHAAGCRQSLRRHAMDAGGRRRAAHRTFAVCLSRTVTNAKPARRPPQAARSTGPPAPTVPSADRAAFPHRRECRHGPKSRHGSIPRPPPGRSGSRRYSRWRLRRGGRVRAAAACRVTRWRRQRNLPRLDQTRVPVDGCVLRPSKAAS